MLVFFIKLFHLIVIMNQTENLYNILEIKKTATQNEIRVSYKSLRCSGLFFSKMPAV